MITMNESLTLYFDGACYFCAAEMRRLESWDRLGKLKFIDIAEEGFDPAPLGKDLAALNRELHGWTSSGECLVGIDSMIAAYTLVNRGWVVAPLRVRTLRPVFRVLYRKFADNRQRISSMLGLKPVATCSSGTCSVDRNPFWK
jgi:predicted DCC family thiol-disulfide oxidoreductase YuxK